jgi:hypothetical protein
MLRCWRILVSAENLDGFDIAQLENLAWRPEQICLKHMGCADRAPRTRGRHDAGEGFIFMPS